MRKPFLILLWLMILSVVLLADGPEEVPPGFFDPHLGNPNYGLYWNAVQNWFLSIYRTCFCGWY